MKRLLTILALSLCAPARAADPVIACDIKVFQIDPDPKGSNIRSGPGSENKVVGVVPMGDNELVVTGSEGKWLRIRHGENVEGTSFFDGEGWVFAGLTGVTARAVTKLHASPDGASPVVGSLAPDTQATVQACSGQWVQVQAGKVKGWMAPNTHCGNPVTTCV